MRTSLTTLILVGSVGLQGALGTSVHGISRAGKPLAGFSPRATQYTYNADGQVTSIVRPDGQAIVPTYEASGRLDFVTIPGGVIDTSYDGAGRVASVSAPGGVGQGFSYLGPLVTAITTSGPVPGSVGYTYDADLAVASRTVNGGNSVTFTYDADGLPTQVGALTLSRSATSGFLETSTLGVTSDSRTRTAFGELDVWSGTASGTPIFSFDLDRDGSGRIVTKTETIEGVTSVWDYGFNPDRGWLEEVRKDGVVVASYGYDANGNRTSWTDGWGTGSATYDDQDRLLLAGPRSYTYTNHGELLTKQAGPDTTTYEYDVRGALLGVDLPTGIAIGYIVDPGGRRIGKRVNGTLVQGFVYAGGLSPVAETDGTGAVVSTFVYATKGNVPDYLVKNGTTYRVFTDHLGSVRLVIDTTTGTVAQRLDYDAYGRITLDTSPGFQPFGYAGGLYDHQTGLTRFGARDYDPESGRWTAKDPIGFAGGSAGLYEYVSNDPVNRIDPTGLKGHHWMPDNVAKKIPNLSPEARLVFRKATSGPLDRPHFNEGYNHAHRAYDPAVRALFDEFVSSKGIDPASMTSEQANSFIDAIRKSRVPAIRTFVENIDAAAARHAARVAAIKAQGGPTMIRGGGGGLARAVSWLGILVTALDAFEYAEDTHYCEEAREIDPCACDSWCG